MSTVFVRSYCAPPIDKREILRYAGVKDDGGEFSVILEDSVNEIHKKLSYNVCFCRIPLKITDDHIDLGFTKTFSEALKKHLYGCDEVIIFAATVGIELDRAIARYSRTSVTRALFLEAIGNERIEALCDAFCNDITSELSEKGLISTKRFSPGYGDLPLELQKDIFRALDCPKSIGLTLNESLLMSPSKSVSAIIGISPQKIKLNSGDKNENNRIS